ncbi:MAG: hypothetical protein R3B40_10010 [Polyangiales bacterium]|nr:hypothetical protein [Myxococcales bacterium]MCB9657914.1 hypothetical protein [Sandaracinaceae bacterium]
MEREGAVATGRGLAYRGRVPLDRRTITFCALAGAASVAACGGRSPVAGPATEGERVAPATPLRSDAASVDDVIDGRVEIGARVRVRGQVVPATLGCVDMVCETESGCCGACGGDAVLVARTSPPPERFLWLSPRTPDGSPDAIGRCHDSDVCVMACTPPSGGLVEIRGEVVQVGGDRGLLVDGFAPAE